MSARSTCPILVAVALLLVGPCLAGVKAGRNAYDRGDYRQALRKLTPAAKKGDNDARYLLGTMYLYGLAVDRDPSVASRWFRLAAESGVVEAQYQLAELLTKGYGVEKDEAEAARWFTAAAEQGDADAMYSIGMARLEGRGVEPDAAAAATWLLRAAEGGRGAAQTEIGEMYLDGRGVERKPDEGLRWLRAAAAVRQVRAMRRLARAYFEGYDVERDLCEARRLIGKPAVADYPELESLVESIEAAMSPEDRKAVGDLGRAAFAEGDYETAAYEWHRAARRGDAGAQYRLALMYYKSYGVVQQLGEAYVWARRAAAQEHVDAKKLADTIRERLGTDDVAWAEYRLEYGRPGDWEPRPVRGETVYGLDDHPEIAPPRLIRETKKRPEFPELARLNRLEAKVILEALILENGHVSHLRVIRCNQAGWGFEESALAAVQPWRYEPARKDGVPVAITFLIVVDFVLR